MKMLSQVFDKTPRAADVGHKINLLAHNVFWFQGVPFEPDVPPDPRPEILEKLCEMYQKLQPDVLCLQEIQNEDTARKVAEKLDMNYLFFQGGSYPQYGGATFSRWPFEEVLLAEETLPDRILIGTEVSFEDGRSIKLANIHLPSNRQRGAEGGPKQRLAEVSQVLEKVDILLGDFNEPPQGPCAALLKNSGFTDAAEACGAGETPSNLSGKRGDHIWISGTEIEALQAYYYVDKEQLAISDSEKKFLSDHLPVGCLVSSN